jgi:glucosamine-6-phosphate deaminase
VTQKASAAPLVLAHHRNIALLAGEIVANRLRAQPRLRLILPTGRTPLGMYPVLRGHAADGSLPSNAATVFQLDEYVGLGPSDPRSYSSYLRRELAGVRFGAVHELDGAATDPEAECARHEALLDMAPIDLAVLGLGRDGHVAFDEPGSPLEDGVRPVRLHPTTRADAADDFGAAGEVPTQALTVGLRTLARARELLLLVTGEPKAESLRAMLEGERGPGCPASLLRDHPRITVVCDRPAAGLLRAAPGWSSDRALVVLGHREPAVSAADRISYESLQRIRRAEESCRSEPPKVAILTGYTRTAHGLSEAEQMKAEWSMPGVPALVENAGRNTAENASCSLPLIRAIGDVRRVAVVTSVWHVRAPYFFAPYRTFGLGLSFAWDREGPWLRHVLSEFAGAHRARGQRRGAMATMRLPPLAALPAGT